LGRTFGFTGGRIAGLIGGRLLWRGRWGLGIHCEREEVVFVIHGGMSCLAGYMYCQCESATCRFPSNPSFRVLPTTHQRSRQLRQCQGRTISFISQAKTYAQHNDSPTSKHDEVAFRYTLPIRAKAGLSTCYHMNEPHDCPRRLADLA
jgi:hypothetical protein